MILNEIDTYREALKKINLNEAAIPIHNGKILTENVDMYFKIQKLLNCQNMEKCHRWLYDLDVENLDESECTKVNNLFKLGVDNGYMDDETDDEEEASQEDQVNSDIVLPVTDPAPVMPTSQVPAPTPVPTPVAPEVPMAAYTVVYSATRDGDIKTGEAYSNSINTRSAKADVISKLEKAGYQNISILAIEAGDPDITGCDNTYCKQSDYVAPTYEDDDEDKEVDEADDAADEETDEETDKESSDATDDATDDTTDKKADDTKKEETAEEPDEKLKADAKDEEGTEKPADDKKEKDLSDQEKTQFKDSYKKAFKAAMQKCKFFDKSFDDLILDEKVKFFTELNKAWGTKADPSKFMSDKELEQLEKIVVKK